MPTISIRCPGGDKHLRGLTPKPVARRTYLNGAGILNRKTGQIEFIKLHGICNRDVQRCYAFSEEDNKGNIWIATMGGIVQLQSRHKDNKQCDDLLGKK